MVAALLVMIKSLIKFESDAQTSLREKSERFRTRTGKRSRRRPDVRGLTPLMTSFCYGARMKLVI